MAAELRGQREVSVLRALGTSHGDSLPTSMEAAVEVFADGVLGAAQGRPVALIGLSSGGILAHATARRLEELGCGPSAVIMLDTYLVRHESNRKIWDQMLYGLLEREPEIGPFTTARLSSMGRYIRLISEGDLKDVEAPVLFLRAQASIAEAEPASDDWRAVFPTAHTTADVPGDHFTMMEEHIATTARAVDDWLRATVPAAG
ncbi:alpha/beta fold hydrolase [Salinispora vitiensis]|uniref:alpha/beta fold hydrolase n=2 Tax=Salinispora TaxID=168694 RepID=UPI000379EC9D|nr:alpha/beta fold hydrolase [Salinispora vitiensis]